MKYNINFDIDLKRNPYKGLYIALEGTQACGKTTQTQALEKHFKSIGKNVVRTGEPRKEGIIGDLIHRVLKGEANISAVGLQYLFASDRALNQEDVVIPALKRGDVVVSSRCFWSSLVYGILDRSEEYGDKNIDQLLVAYSILSMYHQFIVPNFTFYLKIPLEASLDRLNNLSNQKREIYEDEEKIRKQIEGYEFLVKEFPSEITAIDGTKPINEATEEIIGKIRNF